MGKILAICSSETKGHRKDRLVSGVLRANHGLVGDAHAGPWHRQISLLHVTDIEEMRSKGLPNLKFGAFAENLVLDESQFGDIGVGSRLRLGREAEIVITQIGKECHTGCAIRQATGDCIMPTRGLFAKVVRGGEIAEGDSVEVLRHVRRGAILVAILTSSDRCSRGETLDTSGPALAELVSTKLNAEVVATACLPDDRNLLAEKMREWATITPRPDLILTTGGTGLAPRDVTPEATLDVIERRHAGLMELARLRCLPKTPRTFLSRGEAGTLGRSLIINLPGSRRGSTETLEALLDVLPHALATLRGEIKDDGRPEDAAANGRSLVPLGGV